MAVEDITDGGRQPVEVTEFRAMPGAGLVGNDGVAFGLSQVVPLVAHLPRSVVHFAGAAVIRIGAKSGQMVRDL
jgi:hypothetical protein